MKYEACKSGVIIIIIAYDAARNIAFRYDYTDFC